MFIQFSATPSVDIIWTPDNDNYIIYIFFIFLNKCKIEQHSFKCNIRLRICEPVLYFIIIIAPVIIIVEAGRPGDVLSLHNTNLILEENVFLFSTCEHDDNHEQYIRVTYSDWCISRAVILFHTPITFPGLTGTELLYSTSILCHLLSLNKLFILPFNTSIIIHVQHLNAFIIRNSKMSM